MRGHLTLLILTLWVSCTVASGLAAQESLSFTLEEVEARAPQPARPAAVDTSAAITRALGDLRWGMSRDELLKLLKKRIDDELQLRLKSERDIMRQDSLYRAAQERARRLNESYVSFDGHKTGWDVSPIAGEFAHGGGESMLVVAQSGNRDLYFFVRGKLWKWYRERTDRSSDDALSPYRKRFGRGSAQRERLNDSKEPYDGITWSNASTRLTVIVRGSDLCEILEDKLMVEQLAVARRRTSPKASAKTRAALDIDSVLLNDAELKARETRTY